MRVFSGLIGMLWIVLAGAAQVKAPAPAAAGPTGPVARGEYIVNEVANCVQCHTPRSEEGELDRLRLLQGAPIPLTSPWANQKWAVRAPHIAGLPGFTDEDAVSILTKGARLNGRRPQPPMPQFHLTAEDAAAVVAYLRSMR